MGGRHRKIFGARVDPGWGQGNGNRRHFTRKREGTVSTTGGGGSSKVTGGQVEAPEAGWTFHGKEAGGEPIRGRRSLDLEVLEFRGRVEQGRAHT